MNDLRTAAQQALEALERYRQMMFAEAGCRWDGGDARLGRRSRGLRVMSGMRVLGGGGAGERQGGGENEGADHGVVSFN